MIATIRGVTPPFGCGRHPAAPCFSSRFTFCPLATISASLFTFRNPRSRNRRSRCHNFASANSGSIHTFRFRIARSYPAVP